MTSSPPLRPVLRSSLSSGNSPRGTHALLPPVGTTSPTSHVQLPSPPSRPSNSRSNSFQRSRAGSNSQDLGAKVRAKVGFAAMEGDEESLFSFTLQAETSRYERTRETRTFLVAVSPDEAGAEALDWVMEELIEDGDEVVALRVLEVEGVERQSHLKQDELREEAKELQKLILEKNNEVEDREISVVVEFVAGKINESIMRLIALYRPDSLVVGTRGSRGKLMAWGQALGAGMGSVSKYCISHSSVPVIVVRPESKVKKSLAKREKDPKRQGYHAIVGSSDKSLTRSRSAGGLA